ncbi:terminal uridylyltransferase Tailor-like [Drosophila willistoni]|uniref:terminal uridylyltransferase Tailor-like n=1 Tax=Drosophila willistoni TaxID=7260 RepID=UPI001F07B845|nr:terminal uridylyltransferase Tailor-like [Drosophila willistoni]
MLNWTTLCKHIDEADKIQKMSTAIIENDLKEAVQPMFPNFSITLHPFGSRFLGTARSNSDLDIYIKCYAEFIELNTKSVMVSKTLSNISMGIRNSSKWLFLNQFLCGCPIVVARHISTGIQVDISFINEMSYKQNVLLKYMFEIQPIARYMAIYLHQWIKITNISNTSQNFPGYLLNLLVIFFLQSSGNLPSVRKLQENLIPNTGPWISDFNFYKLSKFSMQKIELTAKTLKECLKSFFTFYSDFDFGNYVISPYLGMQIRQSEFINHMPLAFRLRRNKKYWEVSMIVQDLIYLTMNKSCVSKASTLSFKHYCQKYKNTLII